MGLPDRYVLAAILPNEGTRQRQMRREYFEFATFFVLMLLGIAWDFTFSTSKDFVYTGRDLTLTAHLVEGALVLVFIGLTFQSVRLEARHQTTSRKHFWFAIAALCMIATNVLGEDFVFSFAQTYLKNDFDTPGPLMILWAFMLIVSSLVGMWLYGSGIDTYYGAQKQHDEYRRKQERLVPNHVRAFRTFHVSRPHVPINEPAV